jgi:hypothetical protein
VKKEIVDVLNDFIDFRFEQLHTSLPGIVQNYSAGKRLAVIKPAVRTLTSRNKVVELPIIQNVPVCFPSGYNFSLEWELRKDDEVALFFTEAGIGKWIKGQLGKVVDADDAARHALTDAFCMPGIWPGGKAPDGRARIRIDNGLFEIENTSKNLLELIEGLIDVIKGVQTVDFKALSAGSITQLEAYKLQFRGLLK